MADTETTQHRPGTIIRAAATPLGKGAVVVLCIGLIASAGDIGVHLLLESVHLVLEWLELFLEEVLEWVFHLPMHTTQMLTAWIGVGFLSLLAVWLLARFFRALTAWADAAATQLNEIRHGARHWAGDHWVYLLGASLIVVFMLSFMI